MSTLEERKLQFAILTYLSKLAAKATPEQRESFEVASMCLTTTFGIDIADETVRKELSTGPIDLPYAFNAGVTMVRIIVFVLFMPSLPLCLMFRIGYCCNSSSAEETGRCRRGNASRPSRLL
jgi:hypothetical protein